MKYNFDEIIERRNTNALNTDGFRDYIFHAGPDKIFPYKDDEFVRMWVADMEFSMPPVICEAIKQRVDKKILGYSEVFSSSYYEAFNAWCKKLYDCAFPQNEIVFSTGVIPALYELVEDLVTPEEKVLIMTPSYGFFKHAVDYRQRKLVCSSLKNNDGHFSIDFEDFARKAADSKTSLVIWCNPHNPSGRIWTQEELEKIAAIVKEHNLWIISDEIHCDLIRQGKKHIPMAKIMPDYQKLITCMSASKSFNMAGLMFSNIIIRNEAVRKQFTAHDKNVGFVNPLSVAAHQAAYEAGGEWLEQLKSYLDGNFQFVKEFLVQNLPEISFEIPEATYLAWVNVNPYLADVDDIPMFFANEAGVLLEGGDALFVGNAKGYIRLNLAMPRSIIAEGMKRICRAIKKHHDNA
jgi:cysteine-S-conjugate beta-lyase